MRKGSLQAPHCVIKAFPRNIESCGAAIAFEPQVRGSECGLIRAWKRPNLKDQPEGHAKIEAKEGKLKEDARDLRSVLCAFMISKRRIAHELAPTLRTLLE